MLEEGQAKTKVRLTVTDFECSPEEITQILGISPTETWLRGEPVLPKAKNVHHQNGWMIASPCDPMKTNISTQVGSLFSIIEPHIEAFAKLPVGTCVDLSCILYVYDCRPVIGFSVDEVKMLARLGASIDVDFYDLREL